MLAGDYVRNANLDAKDTPANIHNLNLTLPPGKSTVGDVSTSNARKKKRRLNEAAIRVEFAIEGGFEPYSEAMTSVWKGRTITNWEEEDKTRSEVLWDLSEFLFRRDIKELDERLLSATHYNTKERKSSRLEQLRPLWWMMKNPTVNRGIIDIWAEEHADELLKVLHPILKEWTGCPKS